MTREQQGVVVVVSIQPIASFKGSQTAQHGHHPACIHAYMLGGKTTCSCILQRHSTQMRPPTSCLPGLRQQQMLLMVCVLTPADTASQSQTTTCLTHCVDCWSHSCSQHPGVVVSGQNPCAIVNKGTHMPCLVVAHNSQQQHAHWCQQDHVSSTRVRGGCKHFTKRHLYQNHTTSSAQKQIY